MTAVEAAFHRSPLDLGPFLNPNVAWRLKADRTAARPGQINNRSRAEGFPRLASLGEQGNSPGS